MCVCVCVFVCVWVGVSGFEFQGIDQRCYVEDVSFLCQVPSSLLLYEAPRLSN